MESALLEERERLRMLQARVDDQHIAGVTPVQHVAILVEHGIDDDRKLDQVAQRVAHGRKVTRDGR